MTPINKLRLKYFIWYIPFFIIRTPGMILFLIVYPLEIVNNFIFTHLELFLDYYVKYTNTPSWYPARIYLNEICKIKYEEEKERLNKIYKHNMENNNEH